MTRKPLTQGDEDGLCGLRKLRKAAYRNMRALHGAP
jgi:hypothetical protein